MKDLARQFIDTAKIVILATILVIGVQYAFAEWSGPGASPPNGNPDAPVNVGRDDQIKQGGLSVDGFRAYGGDFGGNLSVAGQGAFGASLNVNETVSAQAISASGAITGGSLNVGAGSVTAGHGTFTGGVNIGDNADAIETFLKVDAKNIFGKPSASECNEPADLGKMFLRPKNDSTYLFICGIGTGQPSGCVADSFCWRWVVTNEV